jgi:uncharacterized protein (DUF2252 family)
MASSTHAYVRGNTVKFYDWLKEAEIRGLPEGPAIWICGDCHTGNLGPIANSQGKIEDQIRDLDQTVIGNPVHDLDRLGLSLATAARIGTSGHYHHQHDRSALRGVLATVLERDGFGRLRYAVLLDVDGGAVVEGDDLCLIDIKEGVQAAAPRYADAVMPRDNAERVVEGARHLSPHLGERMRSATLQDRPVVLRELLPQDLKLEIEQLGQKEAMEVARYFALVVGHAHARQMNRADRKRWSSELRRTKSKSIEAPTWLWKSVVELVGSHEVGYLEHCRRYALDAN